MWILSDIFFFVFIFFFLSFVYYFYNSTQLLREEGGNEKTRKLDKKSFKYLIISIVFFMLSILLAILEKR